MAAGGLNVSIVVPAWNEESTIAVLLDSLLGQTRLPDEILVVDAGSSDNTAALVRGYRQAAVPVRLLSMGRAYPGVARNAGAQCARYGMIAFTDCGMRLEAQWLQALCQPMQRDPRTQVIFGGYEPVTGTLFHQCAATVYVSAKSRLGGKLLRGPSVASCLLRRTVWQAVGGFPPYRAAEDLEFLERIAARGLLVAYAPEAVAHWDMPPGLLALFRKYSQYSYHNLVARRGYAWHAGVGRIYLAALPCLLLAGIRTPWWLVCPLALLAARVALALYRKRRENWSAARRDPRGWLLVALIILTFDAATFTGWAQWLGRTAWARLHGTTGALETAGP